MEVQIIQGYLIVRLYVVYRTTFTQHVFLVILLEQRAQNMWLGRSIPSASSNMY